MEQIIAQPVHLVHRGARFQLKGRQPLAADLQAVRQLIGHAPPDGHRRDLLIEYLHLIQDAHLALPEGLLVALAHDMRLAVAEVFEVASFYHHFDIVKDGDAPPALTARVCSGLSCAMAGSDDLLERLPKLLGRTDVRVVAAPCMGRCDQAPAALVGQQSVAPVSLLTLPPPD